MTRIIAPETTDDDIFFETSLRPRTLSDYVGQEKAKNNLRIFIEATGNALETALKCVTPGGKVLPFGMDSSIKTTIVPNEITRWATKILGLYRFNYIIDFK